MDDEVNSALDLAPSADSGNFFPFLQIVKKANYFGEFRSAVLPLREIFPDFHEICFPPARYS